MPNRFNLDVAGMDALRAVLNTFPETMEAKIVRSAVRKAGNRILAAAKAATPTGRGSDKHPGFLRRSLKTRSMKRKKGRVGVTVGPGTRDELEQAGIPVAKGYYPAHVELGTSHQGPTPYLRAPLHSLRASLLEDLRADVAAGIEAEVAKR